MTCKYANHASGGSKDGATTAAPATALAVEGAEHDASVFVNDGGAELHLRGDAVEPVTNRIERWDIAHRDRPLDEATLDDRVLAIHVLPAVDGTNDLS